MELDTSDENGYVLKIVDDSVLRFALDLGSEWQEKVRTTKQDQEEASAGGNREV